MRFLNILFYTFIFVLVLSGCKGHSNNDFDNSISTDTIKSPIASYSINQVALNSEFKNVSLEKAVVDPQDLPITLESVESLTPQCSVGKIDNKSLSFEVISNQPENCHYKYQVKNHPSNEVDSKLSDSEAVVLVSESALTTVQAPISATATANETIDISIPIPDGYSLEPDVVVFGDGEAIANVDEGTISYLSSTPTVTRLIYTLSKLDSDDIKAGYIDVSVSNSGTNAPYANNFDVHTSIPDGTITIDVKDYIGDVDSNDQLQLIDVYSYFSSVSISVNEGVESTSFQFSASQAGAFPLSYVISDHNGGYAIGLIVVTVDSGANYHDINDQDGNGVFTAPLNELQTNAMQLDTLGYFTEDGSQGIEGVSSPIFDFDTAQSYCDSRGMRLPTSVELTRLFEQEGNLYNGVNNQQWPVSNPYLTLDVDSQGNRNLTDLSSGETMSVSSNTAIGNFTCYNQYIGDAFITGLSEVLVRSEPYQYSFVRKTNSGALNKLDTDYITWTSSDPAILAIEDSGDTDTDGYAMSAGNVTVKASDSFGFADMSVNITDVGLLINGDMESCPYSSSNTSDDVPGWSSFGPIECLPASTYGLADEGHDDRVMEIDSQIGTSNDIQQTVHLNLGQTYTIEFDYASRSSHEANNGIQVQLGNQILLRSMEVSNEWHHSVSTYTATSDADVEFVIHPLGEADSFGDVIDNIYIY